MEGRMRGMLIAAVALAFGGGAHAAEIDSAYSTFDFDKCPLLTDEDPITERRCIGHAGIPVTLVNDPDSSLLSFGSEGLIGEYDGRFGHAVAGTTVEWRGPRKGAGVAPFAAIVRFQLCESIGGPCRPELVIFRLEGTRASCIAASLDARRADANLRARKVADERVQGFRCDGAAAPPPE
jgi:hypothetical protein